MNVQQLMDELREMSPESEVYVEIQTRFSSVERIYESDDDNGWPQIVTISADEE